MAVQWPHLRECKVIEVSTEEASFGIGAGGAMVRMTHNASQRLQWSENARSIQTSLLTGNGQLLQAAIKGTTALLVDPHDCCRVFRVECAPGLASWICVPASAELPRNVIIVHVSGESVRVCMSCRRQWVRSACWCGR